MITKQQIKDYIAGRTIRKEDSSDAKYWVAYLRSGILSDLEWADYQSYDGKYKVHRTFDEIDSLVPHLVQLLREGKIRCFKHKSRETPIDPRYADKLPPIFIYLYKKKRDQVEADLDALGLEDRAWIDDKRTALDFERENIERARAMGMDFDGRNFIPRPRTKPNLDILREISGGQTQ